MAVAQGSRQCQLPNNMKNIYLDWNLYSILKKPEFEVHKVLRDFIVQNRHKMNLFYSDAHINDLRQTSKKKKDKLQKDLAYLSEITENSCFVHYFGRPQVTSEKREPNEFYNSICEEQSEIYLKIASWIVSLFLARYGKMRNYYAKKQLKLDARQISNLSKIELDELIRSTKQYENLEQLFNQGIELRGSNLKNMSFVDYYCSAYTSLDFISYSPDKMKSKGSFENLKNDANHSAYGCLCDSFITNDKKCFLKSKFLFNYYKSNSKLIKTCGVKNIDLFEKQLNEILN